MTGDDTPEPRPGRIRRTLRGLMMRPARVAAIGSLSPRFRLVDLEGDGLRNVGWEPGQKIQVGLGGLTNRTYTPMSWDPDRGRTRLLAFAHGDGPGSRWSGGLDLGDSCQFFGPRGSLELSDLGPSVVLFGDETSFALAAAVRTVKASGVVHVFEGEDAAESRHALEAIGLGDAILIERSADDGHLAAAEAELLRRAAGDTQFVLTGRAPSIQRMSQSLKAAGVAASRLKTKAYWAPGKTGLD